MRGARDAGQSESDWPEGPRVTVARGWKRGGDGVSEGDEGIKGLGTAVIAGDGARLSAKRAVGRPANL